MENTMICYIAIHESSGKKYVGISNRTLEARRREHESHAACGTFNSKFHAALRKYGKDNFIWGQLAEGEEEVIKILERVLIGKLDTCHPRGFNSMNEASEFELSQTEEDQLRFNQEMDTHIAEKDMVYDLLDILDSAMTNQHFTQETKELIKPLITRLKEKGNCEYV